MRLPHHHFSQIIIQIMKRILLVLALYPCALFAQVHRSPNGGGGLTPSHSQCLSPEQHEMLVARSQQALQELRDIMPLPAQTAAAPASFMWPIVPSADCPFFSVDAISNYVDDDPKYPNEVSDYNCGKRTYDLESGYNHGGTDIYLWPHWWYVMDQNYATVVAADAGVIYAKDDGNFDRNCGWDPNKKVGNWNAVYLRHDDGTLTWYGHLKEGSLTSKIVGTRVEKGEYLGLVGSSGFSSGPHLHFEVHDEKDSVLDPWQGTCNTRGNSSMWDAQREYYNPKVNALAIHSTMPLQDNCHATVDYFYMVDTVNIGATHYFAIYMADEPKDEPTVFTITDPNGQVYDSWTHTNTLKDYYSSTWWYWSRTFTNNSPEGKWEFSATFKGVTYKRNFYLKKNGLVNPQALKLYSPVDDSLLSDQNIWLDWGISAGGTTFQVQVSDNSRFTSDIRLDTVVNVSEVTARNLPSAKKYYWRVRPLNKTAEGPWSYTWSFKTGGTSSVKRVEDDKSIRIYPNPSLSYIFVESEKAETATLEITDVTGKSVVTMHNAQLSLTPLRIETNHMPSGVYYLTISRGDEITTRSFIKQ